MRFEDKVEELRIKKHKGRETPEFLADVKRLIDGEAYEYLMGQVVFCDAKVDLSLRPMIPRPETEFWVKQAVEEITDDRQQNKESAKSFTFRALDIFAGSGCVGLAVLKNTAESYVDFIELDPKLKKQIEISIAKNNIKKLRTRVLTGDTFEGAGGLYDYIFAVPPYVPPDMKEEVMKELSAEDPLSFFDKEDGFYYHTQVLQNAPRFLKEKGTLYLEFDITQRDKIEELAKQEGWIIKKFLEDPYGHECVVVLKK